MSSPIDIVQQLHDLVDKTYTTSELRTPFELCRSKLAISEMCRKLIRAVEGPRAYSAELSVSCQESAALNLIVSLGIPDLIASSKDRQLTLTELSEKTGAAEEYLIVDSRLRPVVCLNLLLHHGYFVEVGGFGSHVYQNNEFSDVLRSGGHDAVTVKEFVGLAADDGARASSFILEAATQPPPADGEFKRSAHNYAFNTSIPVFQWMASPGNEWRLERTGKAMIEYSSIFMRGAAEDYAWDTLPSPLIDLGGGMGALETMVLTSSEINKNLKFVILDLEKTVEKCKELWEHKPAWIKDSVSFVAGDFMQNDPAQSKIPVPTTRESAGTYFIRHALYNWSDDDARLLLFKAPCPNLPNATHLLPGRQNLDKHRRCYSVISIKWLRQKSSQDSPR
ncbi:hypothetical protein BDP27DRAFT_1358929 [Rhodocollybia butyracea]|uniref:O-methyltransferase C-terminal domain-containing protein n=1 Tax=Rhodocollybia butyracea TaxID=206335 RepID=A0A9P5Q6V6_9AGAR|nr:hypothetical protein BDP27DRAFT_1358929 [Rhodocollybia butyracea]